MKRVHLVVDVSATVTEGEMEIERLQWKATETKNMMVAVLMSDAIINMLTDRVVRKARL